MSQIQQAIHKNIRDQGIIYYVTIACLFALLCSSVFMLSFFAKFMLPVKAQWLVSFIDGKNYIEATDGGLFFDFNNIYTYSISHRTFVNLTLICTHIIDEIAIDNIDVDDSLLLADKNKTNIEVYDALINKKFIILNAPFMFLLTQLDNAMFDHIISVYKILLALYSHGKLDLKLCDRINTMNRYNKNNPNFIADLKGQLVAQLYWFCETCKINQDLLIMVSNKRDVLNKINCLENFINRIIK